MGPAVVGWTDPPGPALDGDAGVDQFAVLRVHEEQPAAAADRVHRADQESVGGHSPDRLVRTEQLKRRNPRGEQFRNLLERARAFRQPGVEREVDRGLATSEVAELLQEVEWRRLDGGGRQK